MATATNLGFSRIGANRELKKALEAYWSGECSSESLLKVASDIRRANWRLQADAGIEQVPTGDFSFYDHVLDTAFSFDVIPTRFRDLTPSSDLDLYFLMARGLAGGKQTQALEMTKWFDTNYHYLVPELESDQRLTLAHHTAVDHFREAVQLGYSARPVLLGPLSFLWLSKDSGGMKPLHLLERAGEAYEDLLRRLAAAGAGWVQIDEPVLALEWDGRISPTAFRKCYERLAGVASGLKLLLTTYFGALRENLDLALTLPVHGLHLDLVRGPDQLEPALHNAPAGLALSLGLINGRNVWKTNLAHTLGLAERAADVISTDRLMIAPSCSLLHAPVDLDGENALPHEIRDWLAFGKQKLQEVKVLATALNKGRKSVEAELTENAAAVARRTSSALVRNPAVRERIASIAGSDLSRENPYPIRKQAQAKSLSLPLLPTTTIGSFPQTVQLRRERLRRKRGAISEVAYEVFVRQEIEYAIRRQEEIGLDVLVHGEAERNDMVEHFGELLEGFAFTKNGWVQSYGSRCVKPPIIYGDVSRKGPMTVDWWSFAQALTQRPVKGMLTGPVTILQWSFVRDDQPRRETCMQIAVAIRDEVKDLEAAGCKIIQIDEPAVREGLPLRAADAQTYLSWAVYCFKIASGVVSDSTQIHTHMCYADFNDIIDAITAMDADVISLESARSQMSLLKGFQENGYPNEIGPGVYDIHSPRVPDSSEIADLIRRALAVIPPERLWVNPDCGLKTRLWDQAIGALENMVAAARSLRKEQTFSMPEGDATKQP